MKKLFYMSIVMSATSLIYSMQEDAPPQSDNTKNNGWYYMITEAINQSNQEQGTNYTYKNISHIKRTGMFWPEKDKWAYDGYRTGQYVDVNYLDNNRKQFCDSPLNNEIHQQRVQQFWKGAPKITISPSRSNQECIKVEIDTTQFEQDFLSRMPWYRKPIPVLSLAIPTTIGLTWLFKSWWDSRH